MWKTVRIPKDLWEELKVLAVRRDRRLEELLAEALAQYLRREGVKPSKES